MNEYTPGETVATDTADTVEVTPNPAPVAYSEAELEILTAKPANIDPARLRLFLESLRKDIDASDPRLIHIWDSAAEIATRKNFCSEFDAVMDELGTGYSRTRPYDVYVYVTLTTQVIVSVTATSEYEAERSVEQWQIEEALEYGDVDPALDTWKVVDSEVGEW